MNPPSFFSEDIADAMLRCEEACRELATACLDMTGAESRRKLPPQHVSRGLDCAYVAGTTARLVGRVETVDADSVALQLIVCERVALALADACDGLTGPGVELCSRAARECASSCVEMRDALHGLSAARYGGDGDAVV